MRLVSVARAEGLPLARDVPPPRPGFVPLVRAGVVLTPGLVRGLGAAGVARVWAEGPGDGDVRPVELLPALVREEAVARLQPVLDAVAMRGPQSLDAAAMAEVEALADRLRASLAPVAARPVLCDPTPAGGAPARHAIGACALGLVLATELAAHAPQWAAWLGAARAGGLHAGLRRLGAGLLLHDVGRLRPDPGFDHTVLGASFLGGRDPLVVAVVRQHHDRMDAGIAPPALARVAAVAAQVDGRIRSAPAAVGAPTAEALAWAAAEAGGAFDADVVDALERTVTPHPPGTEVEVPGHGWAVVVRVDDDDPRRCCVRLASGLELALEPAAAVRP